MRVKQNYSNTPTWLAMSFIIAATIAGIGGCADDDKDGSSSSGSATADTTKPRVISTVPETTTPGPTANVAINAALTAAFSEAMKPATIIDANFEISCVFPCVSPPGAVSYVASSNSLVFTPDSALTLDTVYTATIMSSVTDVAGNALAGNQGASNSESDYVWAFTAEVTAPVGNIAVQSTSPADGGTINACPGVGINATFDVPSGLRINPETASELTFQVVENATPANVVIADSVVIEGGDGAIVTFTPQNGLVDGVIYRATISSGSNGIKDYAIPGNEMLTDYVWVFTAVAPPTACTAAVALNTVAPYGTFGGSAGVTNEGVFTVINGDLGTTGASALVTGFVSEPDCAYTVTALNEGQVNGKIYSAPAPPTIACPQDGTAITQAIANQSLLDAQAAFNAMSPGNLPGGQDPGNDNLASLTLAPGVYTAQSGAFLIQGGDLTLDGQGDQNAVWIFQMATTLTVGGPGADFPQSVILINGAQAKNVFWQVGSAAVINAAGGGTMKGTIIAQAGVSLSTAGNVNLVTLDGRALSLLSSVTMVNAVVNVPAQ